MQVLRIFQSNLCCCDSYKMENLNPLTPRILTPFNYLDWREYMQITLCRNSMYRVTMGKEFKPQESIEKSKFLIKLDEAFGFMCIHISRELLFHLDGLKTPRKVWMKIKSLFGKKYELRGHILDNELISLQPSSFETIKQFFTKYKSLVRQCKQCGIEKKDEQLVLSILSNLGLEFSVFESTFQSGILNSPNQ